MTMKKYKLVSKKGEGTFSEVVKAENIENGQFYAIKCMKNSFKSLQQVRRICSSNEWLNKLIGCGSCDFIFRCGFGLFTFQLLTTSSYFFQIYVFVQLCHKIKT